MSDFDAAVDEILTGLTGEEVTDTSDEVEGLDDDELFDDDDVTDEPDEGDEEHDDEEEDGDVVELDPEQTVRIDGKDVKVADALELKADYTRKTQALAEERREFEAEVGEVTERLDYLTQLETLWEQDPSQVVAGFAASSEDPEDLLAETVVALAQNGAADGNLAVVKALIALASNDLLSEELAEQIGFTDDVIARIKRQAQQETRVAKVERRLKVEDRKMSALQAQRQQEAEFENEVSRHMTELTSQWERIVQVNPEVARMSDAERYELRVALVEYASENDGVPLTVAYDAMEAKRLRSANAKRAADAASRNKKANGARVSSKPTASASAPAPRKADDIEAAIAEAMAELEARNK
jgi:hypothetical protein